MLTVLCGCMFAGKTTRLMALLKAAEAEGRRVLAIKHAVDTRYHATQLMTHDQHGYPALALSQARLILDHAGEADVIGIDEAHFFGRSLTPIVQALLAGQPARQAIVTGLHHDAWGQDFPPLPELRGLADEVEIYTSPCTICASPSEYTQRMVPIDDPTMVGGFGEYEPRCEEHFEPLSAPRPVY
jgi:thymidine kinase